MMILMRIKEANPKVSAIMQEVVALSRSTFGETLRQVWLYGSFARGDANDESDLDFMLVLSKPQDTWQAIDDVFSEFSIDILNRYGEIPSVFITDVNRFAAEHNLLYDNVRKEGVLYYGEG